MMLFLSFLRKMLVFFDFISIFAISLMKTSDGKHITFNDFINLLNNKTMKTIYLVVWAKKRELIVGRNEWCVHEAYLTPEAAEARVKELNAEDTKDVHKVVTTTLNEK